MGIVIGQTESAGPFALVSTWGKLRTPLIGSYDDFLVTFYNYEVYSGFYSNEGLFVRTWRWPVSFFWRDSEGIEHLEYNGPFVGFQSVDNVSEDDGFFSIGAYDWNGNGAFSNPYYTSANNQLDQRDIDEGFVGLDVTYTTGTLTISPDALLSNPPGSWWGQAIGPNTITSVTEIETFTAF
jgi:hypothetical protein